MKSFYSTPGLASLAFIAQRVCMVSMGIFAVSTTSFTQQLNINPRSSLVLNGPVHLVVNNAAFKNDGYFTPGKSTVNFSGHTDSSISYVAGKVTTAFNNLTINKSATGLALKSAVVVTDVLKMEAGNLYTDSNLTLRSTEQLTARVAAVAKTSKIIGKANVERFVPARRAWRLMTAPVTAANTIFNSWQNKGVYKKEIGTLVTGPKPGGAAGNGLDSSVQNTVSMKGWNFNTQGFANVTNTKVPISSGTNGSADNNGYFIFVRGDRNPVNTNAAYCNQTTLTSIGILQTGDQQFNVAPLANKYSLVGNPYAAPVDFNKLKRTNVIKRFYAWDPTLNNVGGYVMLDDLNNDGTFVKTVQGSVQNTLIQSSQAFFVQTLANGPASILFTESSKSVNEVKGMFRPVAPAEHGNGHIAATFNLLEPGNKTILADGVIVEFDNLYSADIDNDDAIKFTNTNENIIIVRNNALLSAERRPALTNSDTVYFRINSTTKRKYQFVFDVSGLASTGLLGFLEDSYLGTSTLIDLSGNTTVNFEVNATAASANVNRFRIVFAKPTIVLPVTISQVNAVAVNNHIKVNWKVENEINIARYEVETSSDGINFSTAASVTVSGASNLTNNYQWLHTTPIKGINYYRIKSYEQSGETKLSAIVKVHMDRATTGYSIYPNPVTGNTISLAMTAQPAGVYQLQLFSFAGQLLLTKTIQHSGGTITHGIETNTKLPAGIYQLGITDQYQQATTLQVIVQ